MNHDLGRVSQYLLDTLNILDLIIDDFFFLFKKLLGVNINIEYKKINFEWKKDSTQHNFIFLLFQDMELFYWVWKQVV